MQTRTLKRLLHYNPDSGELIWLALPALSSVPAPVKGERAGFIEDGTYWVNLDGVDYRALYIIRRLLAQPTLEQKDSRTHDLKWANLHIPKLQPKPRPALTPAAIHAASLPVVHSDPPLYSRMRKVYAYDRLTGTLSWRISPAIQITAGTVITAPQTKYKGHYYSTNKLRWLLAHKEWPTFKVYRKGAALWSETAEASALRLRQAKAAETKARQDKAEAALKARIKQRTKHLK